MRRRKREISLLAAACVAFTLPACDPSVFEYRVADRARDSGVPVQGGMRATASVFDAGSQPSDGSAGARSEKFGGVGSTINAQTSAAAGSGGGAGASARNPMVGSITDDRDAGSSDAGGGLIPDAGHEVVAGPPCPSLPTEADESFCYDFESGVYGPSAGSAYDLWSTPELAVANQLTVVARPDNPQDHVLQTQPSVSASEPSAALGHSTRAFQSAMVDFDLWVDEALIQSDAEISWFRYTPIDGDYDHVLALLFRRGQAFVRSEMGSEVPLRKLPRTGSAPTHVRVQLDRRGPCLTEVWLGAELVAQVSESTCASGPNGFIELGLIMSARVEPAPHAFYDNIAFTR